MTEPEVTDLPSKGERESVLACCPFCGGEAELICAEDAQTEDALFAPTCRPCGFSLAWMDSSEEARLLWNRRIEAPSPEREMCGVCGGAMVKTRGRHPKDEPRKVCPTCLADRMGNIREMAARDYGVAYTTAKVEPIKRSTDR